MMRPITIRAVPTPARLQHMLRRARRSGRFVRVLLDERRDMRPGRPVVTIYDTAPNFLITQADQIAMRMRDGSVRLLKNRFIDAPIPA